MKTSYETLELAQAEYIRKQEKARKKSPSDSDIKDLLHFLHDFGISISIDNVPKFKNVQEMELWKKKKIMDKLDKYDRHTHYKR